MPEFLEKKLEKEYGKGKPLTYKNMQKTGYMKEAKDFIKKNKKKSPTAIKKLGIASKMVGHHNISPKY